MLKQYRGLDKKGKTFITTGPPTDPGDGASQPVWLKKETIRLQSTAAEQRVGVGDWMRVSRTCGAAAPPHTSSAKRSR